jgi:hypothetical protein
MNAGLQEKKSVVSSFVCGSVKLKLSNAEVFTVSYN